MAARILIAGIGNIFLGDDGFGSEVVRNLRYGADTGVRVVDYGIGGMHLAYDLLDDWDALILVDAVPDRGAPGRVEVFEADLESDSGAVGLDAHGMDPATVFASLRALGGSPPRTVVVGAQVHDVDEGIGLSASVRAAVPAAVRAVEDTVALLRAGDDALSESAN
ncbi:hydrogenase maturation protease [Mycolicibacterium confluentis]|uniref:Peptidase M52 n=1 Tax=Mycolicibacterium confluentis TaxID=28047 RepID=A0A7I7Y015_9MYCO|nr:hydrogenase maturation protease [Mycolicibacterium confluentis]MCV7319502.1 hydrogenase maturation protease [Mycolicibacterium confluentis]ORV34132.1 peptidase M52 [Mycolicibacterium confluentis]BBZ34523.1 peptidase M52 [Mycolicibacterium confluentis]